MSLETVSQTFTRSYTQYEPCAISFLFLHRNPHFVLLAGHNSKRPFAYDYYIYYILLYFTYVGSITSVSPSHHSSRPLPTFSSRLDTPLSYADVRCTLQSIYTYLNIIQLTAPDLTYSLVMSVPVSPVSPVLTSQPTPHRPLEEKYAKFRNRATVFCFLLNRVHFIRDQNFSTASLSRSRATLCEILATRTLRKWTDVLELAGILVTPWPVFEGAPPDVLQRGNEEIDDFHDRIRVGNAIEMAIMSEAKMFIKSSPCQKVIDAIWSGKCVYTAQSSHSLLSDTYKRAPIHYYDPRKAPLLDHYRSAPMSTSLTLLTSWTGSKCPQFGRSWSTSSECWTSFQRPISYSCPSSFGLLFTLFVIALELNDRHTINWAEAVFMIYALGFTLEKLAAMQEHGVKGDLSPMCCPLFSPPGV